MHQPEDAIETVSGFIWIEHGILIFRNKGVMSTGEGVTEALGVIRDLSGGVPVASLIDIRLWPGARFEAWAKFVNSAVSSFLAVALLVDPESSVEVGPFPDAMDKLLVPVHLFTDEAEAMEFVRGFLPSE